MSFRVEAKRRQRLQETQVRLGADLAPDACRQCVRLVAVFAGHLFNPVADLPTHPHLNGSRIAALTQAQRSNTVKFDLKSSGNLVVNAQNRAWKREA
jgi:hypothetical protein